jgi:hypothetical protein
MPISVTAQSNLTIVETLSLDVPFASAPAITHNGLNTTAKFAAATTPPATLSAAFEATLAGGSASIDLTALVGTNGLAINAAGLRPRAVKIQNPAENSHPLTIVPGGSGYPLLGSANTTLYPGDEVLWIAGDSNSVPAINAAARLVALGDQGNNGAETHNFMIAFG